jgi:hypothetical protein
MQVKRVIDEDFNNYKTCSMFIGFPSCTWKCGEELCQNSILACFPSQNITYEKILKLYTSNPLSKAIVCGGLEPFDDFNQLTSLIATFRESGVLDTFIIYTGYNKDEISEQLSNIAVFKNIIVKFGRFIPNQTPHFDEILGVDLCSNNQYAEVIS